jgi:hypothetical protein
MSENNGNPTPDTRTWTEEIEVAANNVIEQVQALMREGNVRRLIIKHEGNTVLEVPVTIAAIAGFATLYLSPILAALGALAGLVARVQVVIEREGEGPPEPVDINPAGTPAIEMDANVELNTEPTSEGRETERLV